MENFRKESFIFVDFLRAIAVLLVLWSHLSGWWLSTNNQTLILYTAWTHFVIIPFHLYQDGGHLGVLIFFLISGFIITHVSQYEGMREFIIKRIFRILPTLLISLIILSVVVCISNYLGLAVPLGNQANALSNYIATFFLISRPLNMPDVLSVTWSIFVEVFFYAITAVFIEKTKKNPVRATWYAICIITIIVLLSPLHVVIKKTADLTVYIFYILIGRIIYLGIKEKITRFQAMFLGGTLFFLFVSFYDYLLPDRVFTPPVSLIYSDILAIIIFFVSINLFNKKVRAVSFLSKISYAVYLVHIPMGSLVLNLLAKNGIPFEIGIISAVLVIIVVSYIINRFVEVPSQKIARRILATGKNKNQNQFNI